MGLNVTKAPDAFLYSLCSASDLRGQQGELKAATLERENTATEQERYEGFRLGSAQPLEGQHAVATLCPSELGDWGVGS